MIKRPKYCSKCGAPLHIQIVPAEWVVESSYPDGDFYYDAYDSQTGERQHADRWVCPNWRWWSWNHTKGDGELVVNKITYDQTTN